MISQKKANLLIPMAGKGQRFIDQGYNVSKPFIEVKNKTLVEHSLDCLDLSEYNVIFCTRQHIYPQDCIEKKLKSIFGDDIQVQAIPEYTKGALETCSLALQLCDPKLPVVINSLDIGFDFIKAEDLLDSLEDVRTVVFRAGSPAYSYIKVDNDGKVVEVAEKKVISSIANIGIYIFKDLSLLKKMFEIELNSDIPDLKEYHIAPVINRYISDGYHVGYKNFPIVHVFGTPKEKDFYEHYVLKDRSNKIGFFCDHSGVLMKNRFKNIAKEFKLIDILDNGVDDSSVLSSYSDQARAMAKMIKDKEIDFAFMFCASGNGINIASNKISNKVISSLIYNKFAFKKSIQHNNANVFSIPSNDMNMFSDEDIKYLFDNLYKIQFEGGRHSSKLMDIIFDE